MYYDIYYEIYYDIQKGGALNIILERTRLEANADPALRDDETCSLQPHIHEEISKLPDCTRGFMGLLLVQHLLGTKVTLLGFGGEGVKT